MARFPVETSSRGDGQTRPRVTLTDELWNDYRLAGISRPEAARLLKAGVSPESLWSWLDILGANTPVARIVVLADAGVTCSLVSEYPRMSDTEITSMAYRQVPPPAVHGYGHVFGWCCGHAPAGSPTNAAWMIVPELHRLQVPASDVAAMMEGLAGHYVDVGLLPALFEMRVPPRLAAEHIARYRGLRPLAALRNTWKEWVGAACGHVTVASAVASAGGQVGDVRAWLDTGEPPERIAALVRTGSTPEVVRDGGYAELSDEDLAVWAALTATI